VWLLVQLALLVVEVELIGRLEVEGKWPRHPCQLWMALVLASAANDLPEVTRLLSSDLADPDEHTSTGVTALMKGAHAGHDEVRCRDCVVSPLQAIEPLVVHNQLCVCAFHQVVSHLLACGADPNLKDDTYGTRALMLACAQGHLSVTKALLRHGADPRLADMEGRFALQYAARRGREDVVRMLLRSDSSHGGGAAASACAGNGGDGDRWQVDIAQCDETGLSALSAAAQLGHRAIVRLLLRAGASAAQVDRCGVLLSVGTSSYMVCFRQADETGATALHAACWKGHVGVVEELLSAAGYGCGADAAVVDDEGMDAAAWAEEGGHGAVLDVLRRAAAAATAGGAAGGAAAELTAAAATTTYR
jgi:ankyrin repeat protein